MEEKERYELKIYAGCEYYSITDTKEKQQITIENTINLLNQQDKRIKELEEENNFLEKRNEELTTDRRDICLERNDIFEENQQLKQKAIIPKFSLGQSCFIIWIDGVMLVHIEKIIMELSKDEEETSVDYLIKNHYGYALTFPEEEIFATKEEAEQELAKIKGEKDE